MFPFLFFDRDSWKFNHMFSAQLTKNMNQP